MESAMGQISKIFRHLAREFQIYILSGIIILLNTLLVDNLFYQSSLLDFIILKNLQIPFILVTYILGQLAMGVYYLFFEITGIDNWCSKRIKCNSKFDSSALPKIYVQQSELYYHFVERYAILAQMRANFTASCLINFLVNTIYLFIFKWAWQVCLASVLSFVGVLIFLILTCKTDNDYSNRVANIKNQLAIE